MTKKTCFMIQRFKEPYESRFENIYKPAIECVGLIPYRAGGPSAEDITEDIEDGIRDAYICFADITEDNPNVWYEVGFAYACNKRIVMVCDNTVRSLEKLPFDVRVKNVIPYNNLVDSYEYNRNKLEQDIIEQAKDRVKKADSDIAISPVTAPSKDSETSSVALDRKVFRVIVMLDSKYDSPIPVRSITANLLDENREDVLVSVNKLKFAGYIYKVTGTYNEFVGYSPSDQGGQWFHESNG